MELSLILHTAAQKVDAAGLPPDLRVAAFEFAANELRLTSLRSVSGGRQRGTITWPPDAVAQICERAGLPLDVVRSVVTVVDGKLEIVAPRAQLGSSPASQTRSVALLVVGCAQHLSPPIEVSMADVLRVARRSQCHAGSGAGQAVRSTPGVVVAGVGPKAGVAATSGLSPRFAALIRAISDGLLNEVAERAEVVVDS